MTGPKAYGPMTPKNPNPRRHSRDVRRVWWRCTCPARLHDEADYRNATGALDAMAGFEKVPAASVAHVFHSIMILFIL